MTGSDQVEDKQPLPEKSSTEGESTHNASARLLFESAESHTAAGGQHHRHPHERGTFPSKGMTDLGFPQVEIEPEPYGSIQRDLATTSPHSGGENNASTDGPAPPQSAPTMPGESGGLVAPPRAPGSGGDQPRDNCPAQGPVAPESPQQTTDSGPRTP
ncbi:MAG: hypothetical protein K2W95_26080 [Candidatus Obscuribacterales bacterium]|nr:hypothetical protein [Candidatus Obscuribacterales bacterium]